MISRLQTDVCDPSRKMTLSEAGMPSPLLRCRLEISDKVRARLRIRYSGKRHLVAAKRPGLRIGKKIVEQFGRPNHICAPHRRWINAHGAARGLGAHASP